MLEVLLGEMYSQSSTILKHTVNCHRDMLTLGEIARRMYSVFQNGK
jgi:hypothetical protein